MKEVFKERSAVVKWLRERCRAGAHLRIDSRDVVAGDVFVALKGSKTDGIKFVPVAAARGARAVLTEERSEALAPSAVEILSVKNLPQYLGQIASDFYENPSESLYGIGVTGTNGKTSISHWCAALLTHLAMPCAAVGTIGTFFSGASFKAPALTTPDAVSTQGLLYDLKAAGAKAFAIEASSIGLVQGRLSGVAFKTAVFTNLTRDHLDYHKTFEAYGRAKALLFKWPGLKNAVINVDDAFGRTLACQTSKRSVTTVGYSVEGMTPEKELTHLPIRPLVARRVRAGESGMCFDVLWEGKTYELNARVLGLFNVYNLLAVAAVALTAGFAPEAVFEHLARLRPPAGRLQVFTRPGMPLAVVDYCHTPDAIEKALAALRPTALERAGRLWIVFGAGGDRDHGKRPVMGKIAEQNADCAVVTSDNPRSEAPARIADDICAGMKTTNPVVILNRRKAIVETFCKAAPQDIILVAGKGHEDYQEIAGVKHHFSDAETVREAANERFVRENQRKIS